MKKTLIALAAVAVAGAASAQALTGSFSYGFKSTTVDGVKKSGWGFDDTDLAISASEDLGGGLKIAVSAGFENLVEQEESTANMAGKGATMTLSGAFGSVTMTSAEGSDYLPIDGLTSNANGTDADRILFKLPAMNGVELFVQYADGGSTAATGYGYGVDSSASSNTAVGANYSNGPLTANVTFVKFNAASRIDSRTAFKAGYNFGPAAVTYGVYSQDNTGSTADRTETGLTVSMPVNAALSLDFAYATGKTEGAAKKDGYAMTATYALSKRTSVVAYYESFEGSSAADEEETSIRLVHNF